MVVHPGSLHPPDAPTMVSRREALLGSAALAGGAALLATARHANAAGGAAARSWQKSYGGGPDVPPQEPGRPGRDYMPVVTPGGAALDFKVVDGVKVFHLVSE